MALVGNAQATPGTMNGNQGSLAPAAKPAVDADKAAAFKAKKLEAAKRFAERKVQRAQDLYNNSLKLRDELVKFQVMDKLAPELKNFVLGLCQDPATKAATGGGFGGPSVFVQIFGEGAKVGDKVTLDDIFDKTGKGKSTMDVWLKRWSDKGIEVNFEVSKEKLRLSTYTITKLPA